jgi:cation:H+ antiporter
LVTLSISTREALLLFSLFWAQFVIGAAVPDSFGGLELVGLGVAYLVLGTLVFLRDRAHVVPLIRDGFRTPYHELAEPGPAADRS